MRLIAIPFILMGLILLAGLTVVLFPLVLIKGMYHENVSDTLEDFWEIILYILEWLLAWLK